MSDRTFARIDTTLKGYLRLMHPGQVGPLYRGCQTCAPFQGLDDKNTTLPEALISYLHNLDDKLSAVLVLLNQQMIQDDFPTQILIHDISGAGLRFTSSAQFAIGDQVEIVVATGLYPQGLVGTLGEIIRQDVQDTLQLWVVDFKNMRDLEREKIIQFVIKEQREHLRERRQERAL
ncbi:MAG: PilZ domain-containing protein [Desulfovibrionales bacterium]|nr:PilZ domain-containing protein [Desulfovibrionales bacterium]